MPQRILTLVLLIGLTALGASVGARRLPDNQQGYAPQQPIAYSHRLHAGELGIDCRFCHSAAEHGRHAGIPSADVCMKCHKYVTSSFDVLQQEITRSDEEKRKPERIISPDLQKLYDALGLDDPQQPARHAPSRTISWVRAHNLPDFAVFDHSAHVTAGVSCQKCHGPVESMERLRQFETLSMGWCVNCHREVSAAGIDGNAVKASTDCSVCH